MIALWLICCEALGITTSRSGLCGDFTPTEVRKLSHGDVAKAAIAGRLQMGRASVRAGILAQQLSK